MISKTRTVEGAGIPALPATTDDRPVAAFLSPSYTRQIGAKVQVRGLL